MRTVNLRKLSIVLLSALAVICCVFAFLPLHARASADAVTLEGEGDIFELAPAEYGAEDKFVFSATASFERGNAAGLVFGAVDGEHYWVFNMDRVGNKIKLMYFAEGEETKVLREDYFIGNAKMNDGEKAMVNPKVAQIEKVQLKVIITPENGRANAEFYADGIRRFAFDDRGNDVDIDLNALESGLSYGGGKIGYNCFSAKVSFDEVCVGENDYSYYSELYRQQYHFSQPAHWNNDPNGLVYYNGYYHLYYQHHPFSNSWGDMYWGHARSTDLAHWENLPICLFPDRDVEGRGGDGYMWSGSAMVYRSGMSTTIDKWNWYPNGNGSGLIAFYTRDGARQDQAIMSSDDGGLTWEKKKIIPQETVVGGGKTDCRDPKVFPVEYNGDEVTRWGMAVTGMGSDNIWFMQSTDLYNWQAAGSFKASRPECPDVVTLKADDGTTHTVMTFTGRQYLVGELTYQGGKIIYSDLDGTPFSEMAMNEIPFRKMDFGPDSYATQSFYIDDENSDYYGETVAVSWFSGVPRYEASIDSGVLSTVRKVWNGGGMTIPVIYGLAKSGDGYILTQTPIVKNSEDFTKTSIYSGVNLQITPESDNALSQVSTQNFELEATVQNPENAPVRFLLNKNGDEYTEVGWNSEEGYYVDRSHTGDAGIKFENYARRYVSGATEGSVQTFYVLSDNGSVEVYCDNFEYPFYVLTFPTSYARSAEFIAEGSVTADITVNGIKSVWRETEGSGTLLYVDRTDIVIDKSLTPYGEVTAYAPNGGDISWTVESGNSAEIEQTATGAKIKALSAGHSVILVSCGNVQRRINVTVYVGEAETYIDFDPEGKVAGYWCESSDGIVGIQSSGNGYLLSRERGGDFTYTANFGFSGAAAALVFRAKADMSDYIMANYDHNGRVVKLWSPRGEIGNCVVDGVDPSDIYLSVKAEGKRIYVYINGRLVINGLIKDNDPREGYFGLNVCAAQVTFKSVAVYGDTYSYAGDGALNVAIRSEKSVVTLYNRTAGNILVAPSFYTVENGTLIISREYFTTLDAGEYEFDVTGLRYRFPFTVRVTAAVVPEIGDMSLDYGSNAVIRVGKLSVKPTVNGRELSAEDYSVDNGVLVIYAEAFRSGENTVTVADGITFKVTVAKHGGNTALIVGLSVGGAVVVCGAAAAIAVIMIRRKKKNGSND